MNAADPADRLQPGLVGAAAIEQQADVGIGWGSTELDGYIFILHLWRSAKFACGRNPS